MSTDDLAQAQETGAAGGRTVELGMPVVVGARHGMFGATSGQDTTGYGGLVVPIAMPGASERPYGGWFDACIDALEAGLDGAGTAYADAVEKVVVDRGELTVFVVREHLPVVAQVLRDDPALRFELCLGVSGVHYPGETDRSCTRSTTSVDHPRQQADSRRGHLPRRRPAHPVDRRDLPRDDLARARDLGHVRDHLRRPPGPDADPHARRLAGPPAAQGLPARWHPGRIQGRDRAPGRRAEGVQLMAADLGTDT
jgi:hypothetical protein